MLFLEKTKAALVKRRGFCLLELALNQNKFGAGRR
jgi:hypothetical protein